MILYRIVFHSGRVIQEYGDSVEDVREFCARVYKTETIKAISE